MSKKKEFVDFEFNLLSSDTYELKLYVTATNALVKRQFDKSIKKILKKMKVENPDIDFNKLGQKVEVPKHLINLFKLNANDFILDSQRQVREDKINCIDKNVTAMFFYKKKDMWVLLIIVNGMYDDLR